MPNLNMHLVTQLVSDIWNDRTFEKLSDYVSADDPRRNSNLPAERAELDGFPRGLFAEAMPNGACTLATVNSEEDLVLAHCRIRDPLLEY